jgi:hypothetical protein
MSKTDRIVVYSILGALCIWLLILSVAVGGALREVDDALLVLSGGEPLGPADEGAPDDPGDAWWGADAGAGQGEEADPLAPTQVGEEGAGGSDVARVGIAGLRVLTGGVEMTVTVRAYGAGDLLYEPPVLATEEGQVYPISGESLEAARIAFLELVTSGQATARFVFNGRLSPTEGLWLVFNPSQEPGYAIAPLVEVPVPLRSGVVGGR